jgi:dsDNA-specific endonuclease/ATPase MutS2
MSIEVGDKVKFINENLDGEVLAVLPNNKINVSCSDGFDHEVKVSEVIIVRAGDEISINIDKADVEKKVVVKPESSRKNSILSGYKNNAKYQLERVLEVDLHLEELVEFPNRLDDWQKLHTQMQHVKKCLMAAFDEKIKRVVFIHGVGTGVLKTELRNFLKDYEDIVVKDADFREYGIGATEIIIK